MCAYIYMYLRMHIRTYVRTYVPKYARKYVRTSVRTHVRMYDLLFTSPCIRGLSNQTRQLSVAASIYVANQTNLSWQISAYSC